MSVIKILRSFGVALLLAFSGAAGLEAAAQRVCSGGSSCCQKGSSDGTCVMNSDYGIPKEEWNDMIYRRNDFRYITKRIGKKSDFEASFGLASEDSKTIIKPECQQNLPVFQQEVYPCLKASGDLVVYHESGRVLATISNPLPFDKQAYSRGHRLLAYHGDSVMARQKTAEGEQYVIIDKATGTTMPVSPQAVILPWVRYADAADTASFIHFPNSSVEFMDARQVLAVPTGETVVFDNVLGEREIYRLLDDRGMAMDMPEGVRGVLKIDDTRVPLGYALVLDTPAGRRYVLGARDPVRLMADYSGFPVFTSLGRHDVTSDFTRRSTSFLAGRQEDGLWVITDFWKPGEIVGAPAQDPETAYLVRKGELTAAAAAARLAEQQAADARRLAEAAEDKRRQQAYTNARNCFSAAIAAFRAGRWHEVDDARASQLMRWEATESRHGWQAVGDPGDCSADLGPEDDIFDFEDGSLIQYAPTEDVRAAYDSLADESLKPAFLARWAARDDFPADMKSHASGWAEGVAFGYDRSGKDWEYAGDILYWLAEHGDARAAFVLARRMSQRFPKYTMQHAAEMGSTEAWDYINLQNLLAADRERVAERARKLGEAQAALSNAFKAQIAEDQRCRELWLRQPNAGCVVRQKPPSFRLDD